MKKTNIFMYINLAKMPKNLFWAPLWPKMGTLGTFKKKSVGTIVLSVKFYPRIRLQKKMNTLSH